ncbi:hypothetical protein VSR82_39460 [Burkholderia sp. JPY481]
MMADALPIIAVQPTEPSSRANALITSIPQDKSSPRRPRLRGANIRTTPIDRNLGLHAAFRLDLGCTSKKGGRKIANGVKDPPNSRDPRPSSPEGARVAV